MTYPVWKFLYATYMLLRGSQSSQRVWIISRLETLPLFLDWNIKMQPSTALLRLIHWKVTWNKRARMCTQPILSQHQQHDHQPSFRPALFTHHPSPMRSQMRWTVGRLQSQSFTWMTQDDFLWKPVCYDCVLFWHQHDPADSIQKKSRQ